MTLLAVEGLAKSFGGVCAVAGVDLAVDAGEIVALIGPNGAGKTTCFNMLNGQIRPDAGRVRFAGEDITGWPPRRAWHRGIGRTFQITQTCASMTVRENVQVALLSAHGRRWALWPRAAGLYRDEAESLLGRVGIAGQAERPCAVLAYGDLKRVELAVALAHAPKLLLMDEPTAGMASGERTQLMAVAAGLAREEGVSILFTEHDMDVVFAHADRVVVLDRGRVIAEGAPEAVRAERKVQEVYLGSGALFEPAHAE